MLSSAASAVFIFFCTICSFCPTLTKFKIPKDSAVKNLWHSSNPRFLQMYHPCMYGSRCLLRSHMSSDGWLGCNRLFKLIFLYFYLSILLHSLANTTVIYITQYYTVLEGSNHGWRERCSFTLSIYFWLQIVYYIQC